MIVGGWNLVKDFLDQRGILWIAGKMIEGKSVDRMPSRLILPVLVKWLEMFLWMNRLAYLAYSTNLKRITDAS